MNKESIIFIGFIMALSCHAPGQEVLYPASALSLGMGNANFSSYSISPLYYNPASLAHNTDHAFTIGTGVQYFALENTVTNDNWNRTDIHTSIAYISDKIGLSAIYRQQGDRKTRHPVDDPQSYPPFPDSLKSKDLDHIYSLYFFHGWSFSTKFSVGFIARGLYLKPELVTKEKDSEGSNFSFALDTGFRYEILHETSILLLLQNVLSFPWYYAVYDYFDELEFRQLPLNLQIGIVSNAVQGVTVLAELGLEPVYFYKKEKYYPRNDSFHFGLRYTINSKIRLLAGYQYRRTIRNFYANPVEVHETDDYYEIVPDYVYHGLDGITLGVDVQIKKMRVTLSFMTNDRRKYYADRDIKVTGSPFYYAFSLGYVFQ